MSNQSQTLYAEYVKQMRMIADIRYASALLQWDQETYLPPKGAPIRGQQIATLSELAHRYFTDDSLGALLDALLQSGSLSPDERVNVSLTKEDYDRQKNCLLLLCGSFQKQSIKVSTAGWKHVRKGFSISQPICKNWRH
jgi:Zn-dependent carboxypeptidase